jgi:hypothetical protein
MILEKWYNNGQRRSRECNDKYRTAEGTDGQVLLWMGVEVTGYCRQLEVTASDIARQRTITAETRFRRLTATSNLKFPTSYKMRNNSGIVS